MASHVSARASNRLEVLIGRSLAACVHPLAAWRSGARSFRVMLLAGYFAAGYVTVLVAITVFA
jgi:hypothetical protein